MKTVGGLPIGETKLNCGGKVRKEWLEGGPVKNEDGRDAVLGKRRVQVATLGRQDLKSKVSAGN